MGRRLPGNKFVKDGDVWSITYEGAGAQDDRVGNKYTAGYDEIVEKLEGITNIHTVFNNLENAQKALKEIVAADLGLSAKEP